MATPWWERKQCSFCDTFLPTQDSNNNLWKVSVYTAHLTVSFGLLIAKLFKQQLSLLHTDCWTALSKEGRVGRDVQILASVGCPHCAGAVLEDREGNWAYKYEVGTRIVDCVIAEGLSVGRYAYCSVKLYYHWIKLQGRQCNVSLENTVVGGAEWRSDSRDLTKLGVFLPEVKKKGLGLSCKAVTPQALLAVSCSCKRNVNKNLQMGRKPV